MAGLNLGRLRSSPDRFTRRDGPINMPLGRSQAISDRVFAACQFLVLLAAWKRWAGGPNAHSSSSSSSNNASGAGGWAGTSSSSAAVAGITAWHHAGMALFLAILAAFFLLSYTDGYRRRGWRTWAVAAVRLLAFLMPFAGAVSADQLSSTAVPGVIGAACDFMHILLGEQRCKASLAAGRQHPAVTPPATLSGLPAVVWMCRIAGHAPRF